MRKLLSQLTYSRVVSTLALFLALGAGGAWAISLGKNDVKSRHIAKGAVKSSDVAKKTLRGADVKPDSLKGSKIVESTLDTAQFSAAGATPFTQNVPITCQPGIGYTPCGGLTLQTPVAGRILASASGELIPVDPTPDVAGGECRLAVDGQAVAGIPGRARGDRPFGIDGVSSPLGAGSHSVELECRVGGAGSIQAEVYGITAALIGGG